MITDLFVIIQVQLKEFVTNYNDLFKCYGDQRVTL